MEKTEKETINTSSRADDKTALFETMPVGKALLTMAIPTLVSQLITMIYNLADTFFIGMTNDPYKVAAASVVSILFFILTSLSNLFGVGGGSLMSRLLGEKREEDAKRVGVFSIYGSLAIYQKEVMEELVRYAESHSLEELDTSITSAVSASKDPDLETVWQEIKINIMSQIM